MSEATIPVREVFRSIIHLRGYDPDQVTLSASDRRQVGDRVNERFIQAYETCMWPTEMLVEQRQYRQTWDSAENYADGAEVYAEDSDGVGAYYVSQQDSNVNHDPTTDTTDTWWALVGADFLRTIDFAQDDQTVIGAVDVTRGVFARDPRVWESSLALKAVRLIKTAANNEAILVATADAPLKPWIMFRPETPEFTWDEWVSTTAYAINDLAYYSGSGHSYKALLPSTNKRPDQQTAYWKEVPFPKFFRRWCIDAVRADQLDADQGRARAQGAATQELESMRARAFTVRGVQRRARYVAVPAR